jgi:TolB-like protein
MNFVAELRRRNVIRMAGLYLVGAWLLTQVSSTVLPMFDAPAWLPRSIVMLLAIGFIPALVFAWVFELTPQGLKRDAEVKPEESIAPQTARRMDRLIIVVLICALVYFGVDKFALAPRREAALVTQTEQSLTARTALSQHAQNDKSIAVLPFENLSEDKANAYFATGMQDEILTRLAGIHDLKVISRTSTEQYASRPPNLKIVAEQLGVATVLEGSVQRADGKVRINLQLIDARSDSHLWAQNYDRDLKDVFAVQSDVAEKVADALQAQLLPAESARNASVPTQNQEAYDLFLKAEDLTRQVDSNSAKDLVDAGHKAEALYRAAIAAAPDFALAYARLSYLKGQVYWRGIDPGMQAIDAAQAAAMQALALQPNLPQAHLAMGYVYYHGRRDYAGALAQFATARASLPNDASAITAMAYIHRRQGNLLQAISELKQAVALDPRSSTLAGDLADTLAYLRRYPEASAANDRSLALNPDNVLAQAFQAATLRMQGDLAGASRALAAIAPGQDAQGSIALERFHLAMAQRQPDAALVAIANAPPWLLDGENNLRIPAVLLRGQALALKGEGEPARLAFLDAQRALEGLPHESQDQAGTQSNLAFVYAGLGHTDAALVAARRATDLLPISQDGLDGPFYLVRLAKIEAQAGETDAALKHIEQLLAMPAGNEISAASLRTDPAWDPLRKNPHFQKLIADADKSSGTKP